MRIKLFILFLISFSLNVHSQLDSLTIKKIHEKANLIDGKIDKPILSKEYTVDTLIIESKLFINKIQSRVSLPKTTTTLSIDCYLDEDQLYFVRVKEESPKAKDFDEIFKLTELYYIDNKIIDSRIYYGISTGMSVPPNFEKYFGYNQRLNKSVLEEMTTKIIFNTTN